MRTKSWLGLATLALIWVGSSSVGNAQHGGTHGLFEVELGATLSGDGGAALSFTAGVGGKPRGFPARFYLIGRYAASEYEARDRLASSRFGSGSERGSFQDLALGARMYLPLPAGLRWYADALVGGSYVEGSYTSLARRDRHAQEWLALANLSTGLQLRLMRSWSLGLRASFSINEEGLVGVMRSSGVRAAVRPAVMGGATWHF